MKVILLHNLPVLLSRGYHGQRPGDIEQHEPWMVGFKAKDVVGGAL